ncbi:MAG: nucleotidyltransferase domain-containing protein [Nitrospiria bacterium]
METKSPKQILKVVVGSRAHGLATPTSDFDYRGVFVNPTSEILSLKNNIKQTQWIEGKEDDVYWEIGHFLFLATKCNPTILETFLAPVKTETGEENCYSKEGCMCMKEGLELRELFPYVWNSKGVRDAFIGYAFNQQKKFLEDKDNRASKYAAAYLRTLYNAWELLSTGTFTVRISDTPIGQQVKRFKEGDWSVGEVMQSTSDWQKKVEEAYEKNPYKQTDLEKIDEFLLKIRKAYW